jgi:hypothetical protein
VKILFPILTVVAAASLGPRMVCALAPDQAARQESAEGGAGNSHEAKNGASANDGQKSHRTAADGVRRRPTSSGKKPGVSQVHPTTPNRSRVYNNPAGSASGSAADVHAWSSNRTGSTPLQGIVPNGTNNTQSFRSPSVPLPASPAFNARHPTPNPPAVSGTVNSAHRSTGAISGTSMNRPLRSHSR